MGIASQNLMEDLHDKLMEIKERDLDVDEIAQCENDDDVLYLKSLKKGNKIIGTREYLMVLYITSFVPFIRQNVPMIKEQEIKAIKDSSPHKKHTMKVADLERFRVMKEELMEEGGK